MRIGFHLQNFDPAKGGAEVYLQQVAPLLVNAGHDVHIFCAQQATTVANVTIHQVDSRPAVASKAIDNANLDIYIGGEDSLGMDIFQPHSGTIEGQQRQKALMSRGLGLAALRRASIRYFGYRLSKRKRAREQFGTADQGPTIIAMSNMVKADMQTFYGVAANRIHVAHNGVDVKLFSPERCAAMRAEARESFGVDDETLCILQVAHNFKLKGVREAIEAFGAMKEATPKRRLLIAGHGATEQYEALAARLGCGEHVRFLGHLKDVMRAYAAADIFVHPTWYDACSLAVLEALACGLPTITTSFNGVSELMTHEKNGLVISSPANQTAFVEQLRSLFDADRRKAYGAAARELALAHTLESHVKKVLRIYEIAHQRKLKASK